MRQRAEGKHTNGMGCVLQALFQEIDGVLKRRRIRNVRQVDAWKFVGDRAPFGREWPRTFQWLLFAGKYWDVRATCGVKEPLDILRALPGMREAVHNRNRFDVRIGLGKEI